jgi:hypothetical protein
MFVAVPDSFWHTVPTIKNGKVDHQRNFFRLGYSHKVGGNPLFFIKNDIIPIMSRLFL